MRIACASHRLQCTVSVRVAVRLTFVRGLVTVHRTVVASSSAATVCTNDSLVQPYLSDELETLRGATKADPPLLVHANCAVG